jgi:hypothetical protein
VLFVINFEKYFVHLFDVNDMKGVNKQSVGFGTLARYKRDIHAHTHTHTHIHTSDIINKIDYPHYFGYHFDFDYY